MPSATLNSAFWRGFLAGLPFVIVVIPFSILFGVVASEAGLPILQVMGFSFLVIAGASQFTALQFMSENAPTIVVLASALAVNLRMVMYSAALTPHLGTEPLWKRVFLSYFLVDQTYLLSASEFEKNPNQSSAQKAAFFFGCMVPICPLWYLFTWFGAVVGKQIPTSLGIDFIVPIAFLAMVAPALRTPAHIAAAFVSIVLALALFWIPFNLGLLVAATIAMMVGAEIERRTS